MNILDLTDEIDLFPKRVASTHGGEYKSACPKCKAGKDRFCIWPNQGKTGRYWCRVCECKGDGIQFCRDFLGMTFHQACKNMNITSKLKKNPISYNSLKKTKFIPQATKSVDFQWQQTANIFVGTCHQKLMNNFESLNYLIERGLSIQTICKFYLGWNEHDLFDDKKDWGFLKILKENGYLKKQWLPNGIVIPTFINEKLTKIKIRRSAWNEKDHFPKYIEISGSNSSPSIYGDISKPIIIIESELDAILIQQYASHLVCCLALGGVSKKPDYEIHKYLKQASLILLSSDFDNPGKKKYGFWMKLYPNLRPWPAPKAKSIGDSVQIFQTDVLSWIRSGLKIFH